MPNELPFTWKPDSILEVTNVSAENFLLELDSGPQRLDAGRTLRLTASALDLHHFVALANAGKLKVQQYKRRK